MVPTIRVAASAEQLAWQAAEAFAKMADDAIVATGRFVVAFSGGSTPEALLELLAAEPFSNRVDWAKTHVLFVDERCVPAGDPQSNFGMVCRTLLDHVPVPYGQIHRVAGEKEPEQAAAEYERLLVEQFPKGPDLALLGMGADGHTASLFPGTDALAVTDRVFVANYVTQLSAWRLTMTLPYLNRAFDTLVLVSGASKAEMVNEVLVGMGQPARYPIQKIQPASGRLVWMMDAEAAGMDAEEDFADEAESDEMDEEGSD